MQAFVSWYSSTKYVIEAIVDIVRDAGIGDHLCPIQKKVVIIEDVLRPESETPGQIWSRRSEICDILSRSDLERVRLWFEPHLDLIHEDSEVRHADLVQLEQIASGYPSRERFLTELNLDPPAATSDQAGVPLMDEDYLILSTIHPAKGQEWKSVYVLNVVDGYMPSDRGAGTSAELEEERRLCYVAMTRAKDGMHLVVPQRFFAHGQHSKADRQVYASDSAWPGVSGEEILQLGGPTRAPGVGRAQNFFWVVSALTQRE